MDNYCGKCGNILYGGTCACMPYSVLHNGKEHHVYALGACDAARRYARQYNESKVGVTPMLNEDIELLVTDPQGDVLSLSVEASLRWNYLIIPIPGMEVKDARV